MILFGLISWFDRTSSLEDILDKLQKRRSTQGDILLHMHYGVNRQMKGRSHN